MHVYSLLETIQREQQTKLTKSLSSQSCISLQHSEVSKHTRQRTGAVIKRRHKVDAGAASDAGEDPSEERNLK